MLVWVRGLGLGLGFMCCIEWKCVVDWSLFVVVFWEWGRVVVIVFGKRFSN